MFDRVISNACAFLRGNEEIKENIRVCFMGGGGVGSKSALIIQFVMNHFVDEYDPTIEDSYLKEKSVDGSTITIFDILDTAGQEEYSAMRSIYYQEYESFTVGFAVTSRNSFDEMENFYKTILSTKGGNIDNVPVVFIANKIDLVDEIQVQRKEVYDAVALWTKKYSKGSATCKREKSVPKSRYDHKIESAGVGGYRGPPIVFTSAKTREGVDRVFEEIIRATREKRARCPAWHLVELIRDPKISATQVCEYIHTVLMSEQKSRGFLKKKGRAKIKTVDSDEGTTPNWLCQYQAYYPSPLITAILYGNFDKVELLTEMFPYQINRVNCSGTSSGLQKEAIVYAVHLGRPRVLSLLLEKGADTRVVDNKRHTLLHIAATNGFMKCLEILLSINDEERKLDVNATLDTESYSDDTNCTPLIAAAESGRIKAAFMLLRAGAKPGATYKRHTWSRSSDEQIHWTQLLCESGAVSKEIGQGLRAMFEGQDPGQVLSLKALCVVKLFVGEHSLEELQKKLPADLIESYFGVSASPHGQLAELDDINGSGKKHSKHWTHHPKNKDKDKKEKCVCS